MIVCDITDLSRATNVTDLSPADVDDLSSATDVADLSNATDVTDLSNVADWRPANVNDLSIVLPMYSETCLFQSSLSQIFLIFFNRWLHYTGHFTCK